MKWLNLAIEILTIVGCIVMLAKEVKRVIYFWGSKQMTQERLMERLWLMLQPYGWELRKGHLYRDIEVKLYGSELIACANITGFEITKENKVTDHVIFKMAFNLIEALEPKGAYIRHMTAPIEFLMLDSMVIPAETNHIMFISEDHGYLPLEQEVTIKRLLRDMVEDIGERFAFGKIDSGYLYVFENELFKGIDKDTLDYEIFQEEGDLQL